MPTIKVPKVKTPKVDIPEAPYINENTLTGIVPGCNLYHRDLEITKNPSILFYDRKAFVTCPEGEMPSFNPIEYDEYQPINTLPPQQSAQQPEYKPVVIPPKKEDKKPIEIPPCPGKKDLRVGSFVNEKRLERVSGIKEAKMELNVLLFMKTYLSRTNTYRILHSLLALLLLLASLPLLHYYSTL